MARLTREEQEDREQAILAPYAVKSGESRGRQYPEDEHPYRTCFQRDRDRVVHCEAFRRMEYKTQVFITGDSDYYRTRLTHTLEVSQISRTLARMLALNEDLTEALALVHDLGHPPFGHMGERVLNGLMKEYGGFEHNAQALRIVDVLECRYPDFPGLNLTAEMRRGILKNKKAYDGVNISLLPSNSVEAQIVDIADEISYTSHDLDDGITAGLLSPGDILQVTLWREAHQKVKARFSRMDERRTWYQIVIAVINTQVTDVAESTTQAFNRKASPDYSNMVGYSAEMKAKVEEAKDFLYEQLYRHPKVMRASSHCQSVLTRLFEYYCSTPDQLPISFHDRIEKNGLQRTVSDYLAGMTDRFAKADFQRLFGF